MSEMNQLSESDIRTLVDLVGREGAIAALSDSKKIEGPALANLANKLRLKVKTKDSKKATASAIVRHVDKRITKSLEELKRMPKDDLIQYFEKLGCDQDELVELLASIDFRSRASSRRAMIEFAAIQISSLGIFERLAER